MSSFDTYVASDKQPTPPAVERQILTRVAPEPQAPSVPAKNGRTQAKAPTPKREQGATAGYLAGTPVKKLAAAESKDKKADDAFTYPASAPAAPPLGKTSSDADKVSSAPPAIVGGNAVAVPSNAPQPTTETAEVTAAPSARLDAALAKPKQAARAEAKTAAGLSAANRSVLATAASAPAGLMPDLKAPRWGLSQDGLPQRSFDSGDTWEKIQVDHKTGFRALTAAGSDVWVGGSSGLLYHSADMGLHWTRIIPVSNEETLSADITHIEFANALRGQLTTANGETWVTSDGGKTWERH